MESSRSLENISLNNDNTNNIYEKIRNLFYSILSFFILFFTSLIYPIKNEDENNTGILYFLFISYFMNFK
jgi:hypothetical protein